MEENANIWFQVITAATAALGAILGIMNTWRAMSQNRIKIKVRPNNALSIPDGTPCFAIEVINLSNFAVTISDIGFTNASNTVKGMRFAVTSCVTTSNRTIPVRLQPREAESFYFDPISSGLFGKEIGKAYARTSCGEVMYGTSPALSHLREALLKA